MSKALSFIPRVISYPVRGDFWCLPYWIQLWYGFWGSKHSSSCFLNTAHHCQGTGKLKATHRQINTSINKHLTIPICFAVTEVFAIKACFYSSNFPSFLASDTLPPSTLCSWPGCSLPFRFQLCLFFYPFILGNHIMLLNSTIIHIQTWGNHFCLVVSFNVNFA